MDLSPYIYIECRAEVVCGRCGNLMCREADSEQTAERLLEETLRKEGWQMTDEGLRCGECVKPKRKRR